MCQPHILPRAGPTYLHRRPFWSSYGQTEALGSSLLMTPHASSSALTPTPKGQTTPSDDPQTASTPTTRSFEAIVPDDETCDRLEA